MNMKLIKNNAFFLGPSTGETVLSISTSNAKLGGTSGLTLGNSGKRNCSAMLFTSTKGCASCGGKK